MHASNASIATGLRTTWSSTTDSIFDGVVDNGYQTASSLNIAHAAGTYQIGGLTLGLGYSYTAFNHDAQSIFQTQEHFNSGKAFAYYQMTPSLSAGGGFIYTRASGNTDATYPQVSLGSIYALSKRTDFYTQAVYQHASGLQRTVSGGVQNAVASIGSYGITGDGRSQEMVVIGMRHRF